MNCSTLRLLGKSESLLKRDFLLFTALHLSMSCELSGQILVSFTFLSLATSSLSTVPKEKSSPHSPVSFAGLDSYRKTNTNLEKKKTYKNISSSKPFTYISIEKHAELQYKSLSRRKTGPFLENCDPAQILPESSFLRPSPDCHQIQLHTSVCCSWARLPAPSDATFWDHQPTQTLSSPSHLLTARLSAARHTHSLCFLMGQGLGAGHGI